MLPQLPHKPFRIPSSESKVQFGIGTGIPKRSVRKNIWLSSPIEQSEKCSLTKMVHHWRAHPLVSSFQKCLLAKQRAGLGGLVHHNDRYSSAKRKKDKRKGAQRALVLCSSPFSLYPCLFRAVVVLVQVKRLWLALARHPFSHGRVYPYRREDPRIGYLALFSVKRLH